MLGKIHIYTGVAVIIIFLLTGQFMHHNYDHLKTMESMNRALFRAGHLYILLFGLINISLGSHFKLLANSVYKKVQQLGSIIVFLASALIIFSFFRELPTEQIERPIARYSLYLALLGVSIHGMVALIHKEKPNRLMLQ